MSTQLWDVAVVGAGPAGSATATLLARNGYRVILLDRCRFPRHKACAEYMSPGVTAVLRRTGLDAALAGVTPEHVSGMQLVSPRGTALRLIHGDGSRQVHGSTLPRYDFDAHLVAQAARAGVEVLEGFVVHAPLLEGGQVRGVSGFYAGKDQAQVEARLTIACDGNRSVLSRALGLATPPRWPVRLGLVAHYEGQTNLPEGFAEMHVEQDGYCGLAPLPGGRLNVSMVVPLDALRQAHLPATRFFEQWIASHPHLREAIGACRRLTSVRGVAPVGARSRRAWAPGALLVGDAAGFFDPFTGEGIYRALRGAELAARAGTAALEVGDVSGRMLQTYQRDRREFRWKGALTTLVQLFVQYPALIDYALPRLSARPICTNTLGAALSDTIDAREFLAPRMLWAAFRP